MIKRARAPLADDHRVMPLTDDRVRVGKQHLSRLMPVSVRRVRSLATFECAESFFPIRQLRDWLHLDAGHMRSNLDRRIGLGEPEIREQRPEPEVCFDDAFPCHHPWAWGKIDG